MSQGKSAAHTPGPWGYSEGISSDGYRQAGVHCLKDNGTICPATQTIMEGLKRYAEDTQWGSYEEDLANARLIAAGPTMLEALEQLCTEAESWHTMHGHETGSVQCDSICHLIPKMQTAIRLARGEYQ